VLFTFILFSDERVEKSRNQVIIKMSDKIKS